MDHIGPIAIFFNHPDKGASDDDPVEIRNDLACLLRCGYTKADDEGESGYLPYPFRIPFDVNNPRPCGPRDTGD